jgi:predicted small integral membrane protein
MALAVTFFGVEQILHPEFVPAVPLDKLTPLWIPAHLLWGYLTGVVFVVGGIALLINKQARAAKLRDYRSLTLRGPTLGAARRIATVATISVPYKKDDHARCWRYRWRSGKTM